MLERAFKYEYTRQQWIECCLDDEISADIEKLAFHLIVHGPQDDSQGPKKAYRIARCSGGRVSNCVCFESQEELMSGFNQPGLVMEIRTNDRDMNVFPLRWRIFQRNVCSPLNIAVDLCHMAAFVEKGCHYFWRVNACNFDLEHGKVQFVRNIRNNSREIDEEQYIRNMPPIVADAAMEAMRSFIKARYGIKGGLLSRMTGYSKLMAYWERPFDLHIVYLKYFIGDDFAKLFPYEEKNCYAKLCDYLGVRPPKSVRKAYTYNPYAILWYLFFQAWGIRDINMLQPFLLLDDSIGNFQLGKFVYDRKKRKIIRYGFEHGRLWRALEWYLLWLKEEKGVKYFCEYLYAVTLHPLFGWQMDTMDAFYEYREKMPKIIRDAVLRDGFTPEIHDAVSEEINCLTWQEKNVRIVYPAELLMLECRIDDYQFQLVPDSKNFRYIGIHMHNCIASYRQRVLEGDSAIIVVTVGEAYAACVEIDANKNIVQALGTFNRQLQGRALQVCRYWAQKMQLPIATDQLNLGSGKDLENIPVEPLPATEGRAGQRKSADHWLDFEKQIQKGKGFFSIAIGSSRRATHVVQPPPWKRFASEREYINYVFPPGKYMYEAAISGEHEAQLALAVLYSHGKVLAADSERAGYWQQLATGIHRDVRKNYHDECLLLALARAKMRAENNAVKIQENTWRYRMPAYHNMEYEPQKCSFSGIIKAISNRGVQMVLREIDQKDLVLAILGTDKKTISVLYANMSYRAGERIREEAAFLKGRGVCISWCKEAQRKIVNVARGLEDRGEIIIGH